MSRKLSRCEQETIISRTADEEGWNVYTCDPVMKRRLGRLAIAVGVSPTIIDRDGVEFTLPLNCVRFSPPQRRSDAQRASAMAALQAARARKAAARGGVVRKAELRPDNVPALEGSRAC